MRLSSFKHVIGYATLAVLCLAGTAQALPGQNTVDSADIINGQVKRADVGADAINSSKVLNGSLAGVDLLNKTVTGAKIADWTITGAKVADNGLTGQQVAEHTLNMSAAGCQVGLVHSFTQVSAALGADWTALGGFNCSGGQILARNPSTGIFHVKFVGDPAVLGVAQAITGINNVGVVKVEDYFHIEQRNYNGDLVDNTISFVTY